MTPRIFLGLPAFGQIINLQTTLSLLELQARLYAEGISPGCFTGFSHPDIADSRNILATIFLDATDCTHLLMVDADMQFEPDLVLDMLAFNYPVVGCLYPTKTYPLKFVMNGRADPQEIRRGFLRVDGVGAGVMLIRRDALEQLKPHVISDPRIEKHGASGILKEYNVQRLLRYFDIYDDGEHRFSEDLAFCRRWTDIGGEIWAAMNHKVIHIGLHGYSGKFSEVNKFLPMPVPSLPPVAANG